MGAGRWRKIAKWYWNGVGLSELAEKICENMWKWVGGCILRQNNFFQHTFRKFFLATDHKSSFQTWNISLTNLLHYSPFQNRPNLIFMSNCSLIIEINVKVGVVYWCKSLSKSHFKKTFRKNPSKWLNILIFTKSILNYIWMGNRPFIPK